MYHLRNQQRFDEFRRHPVEQLDSEAALLRVCIEQAMNENHPNLVNSLIATYSKIAAVHQQTQIRAGVLLEKDRVLRICNGLITLLCNALKDRQIPEGEAIIEEITCQVDPLFDEIQNEKKLLPAPKTEP